MFYSRAMHAPQPLRHTLDVSDVQGTQAGSRVTGLRTRRQLNPLDPNYKDLGPPTTGFAVRPPTPPKSFMRTTASVAATAPAPGTPLTTTMRRPSEMDLKYTKEDALLVASLP